MEAVSPPRIVADRFSQSALLQGRSRQTDRSLQGTLRDAARCKELSVTITPDHRVSSSSSLLTTRSWFSTRCQSKSKIRGCKETSRPLSRKARQSLSSSKAAKRWTLVVIGDLGRCSPGGDSENDKNLIRLREGFENFLRCILQSSADPYEVRLNDGKGPPAPTYSILILISRPIQFLFSFLRSLACPSHRGTTRT